MHASSIATMTIEDVTAHLSAVSGLEPFADAIISSGINCDGELLATLVDKASIKASPFRRVGRKFSRSLLAKEVRELHKKGLPSTAPAACALSGEDAATRSFALLHAGDIEAPRWETAVAAECSDNGATGVIFVNTAAGSFVVKAAERPVAEAFATALALDLGMPAARIRAARKGEEEYRAIKRALSSLTLQDGTTTPLQMQLWSTFKRDAILIIELVEDARLLWGMEPTLAAAAFNATTDSGQRCLTQLGELIAFDALINNGDRVPIVHSNIGNPRNVVFSGATNLVAIDQAMQSFATNSKIGRSLYDDYVVRVGTWLRACLFEEASAAADAAADADPASASASASTSASASASASASDARLTPMGAAAAACCAELQAKHDLDPRTAEVCIRAAGFNLNLARSFPRTPGLLAYATRRGANAEPALGSLGPVRDFIARFTAGADIGVEGCALVRHGVCTAARRIASDLDAARIARVRDSSVGSMAECDGSGSGGCGSSALHGDGGAWGRGVAVLDLTFLESMVSVFRDACAAVPESRSAATTPTGSMAVPSPELSSNPDASTKTATPTITLKTTLTTTTTMMMK